jgi:hypothetical protein
MKKKNTDSNAEGVPYITRSSVKPENVVLPSNNNTILKISKDVNFLYNLIQYAVKSQERIFFLILSEDPLLDVENLKQYLMERELTEFFRNEILKISEIINNAILLQSEYEKIPSSDYYTEFDFIGKKGEKLQGAFNGTLFYCIITKNGIIKSNKDSFIKESENLPFFYMLDIYRILNSFSEMINLVKLNPTPLDINTNTDNENEDKPTLHNNIFKDNAFEIWERLFENLNIDETKRTDLRFLYEAMKYGGQIHTNITIKNFTEWVCITYQYTIDKLHYTDIWSKSNETRMSIYNLINNVKLIRWRNT